MKQTVVVNGLDVSDGPVTVYRAAMSELVELAVEGWCARHAITRETALEWRAALPRACGCSGAPIPVAGFPCWCELNTICEQIALGEEPNGWRPGERGPQGATWRERLAEVYAKPEPSWPKGKPRPLP